MIVATDPGISPPSLSLQEKWEIGTRPRDKDSLTHVTTRQVASPTPLLTVNFTLGPLLQPIVQLPGLDFFKAWMDCYRVHYLHWTCGLDLGTARLRDFMWDPVTECGVLNNFDVRLSANPPPAPVAGTRTYAGPGDSMLSELLGCKEFCKWRSKRVRLDRIEPFVWILVEMCLGGGGLELSS